MAEDREHEQTLRRHVAETVALESDIERALEHQLEEVHAHPETAAVVRHFRELARSQREALEAYLERQGDETVEPTGTAVAALFGASAGEAYGVQTPMVSDVLRADYAAFNFAAISYATLCEMGLRLYDPPLREIAELHLRAYAEATQQIDQLIASVVAWELQQQGLECRCMCPMCSMGACGCVAAGTYHVNEAWRETAPSSEERARVPAASAAIRQPTVPHRRSRGRSPLGGKRSACGKHR